MRFDDSAQRVRLGLMRKGSICERSVRMTQATRAQQHAAGTA